MKKDFDMRFTNKILFFVLLHLFSFGALAQTLSVQQAIEVALANNFDIRIAEIQKGQNERMNTWGQAGRLPSISARVSQRDAVSQNNNPASFIQGKLLALTTTPNVDLNWVLFKGFSINITKEKLANLAERSAGNEVLIIENTVQAVLLAYYRIWLEKERIAVYQKMMNDSRAKYSYLQSKQDLGLISSFDVLQEKSNYLSDSSSYIQQMLSYDNAVRNLNMLLNQPVENKFEVSDSISRVFDKYDIESLKTGFEENNTNLKIEAINLAIKQNDYGLSKSQLYPTLTFNLGGNFNYNYVQHVRFEGATTSYDYYANFTLSWTLFNGGQVKRAILNSYDDIEIQNLKSDQTKLNLTNNLISTHALYDSRLLVLDVAKLQVETNQLNLDMANERYKSGLISSFDLRTIQNTFLNSKLQELNALYLLLDAETELLRLTGGILKD